MAGAEVNLNSTVDIVGAAALAISDAVWEALSTERSDVAALNLVIAEVGPSIGELARSLKLSHSATVRLVDRLEAQGLVARSRPGPGRTVLVLVTTLGRKRSQRNSLRRSVLLERAIAGFTTEERRSFVELLVRATRNLARDQNEIDRACRLCEQSECLSRGCPLPT